MMKKLLLTSLVLCLSFFGTTRLSLAQTDRETPTSKEPLAKFLEEGWKPVAEGVLQRQKGGNKVESLAYGVEGLQWALQDMETRQSALVERYQAHPSPELQKAVHKLKASIDRIQASLDEGKVSSSASLEKVIVNGCDVSYGAHADAFPLSPGPGVGATADSYFYNNCGYSGEVYAQVNGDATSGSIHNYVSQTDGPKYGGNISASASVNVNGRPSCHSDAYSYTYSSGLGIWLSASDSNDTCPDPPLSVSISGPASTTVLGYACKTLTWTASASGGVPPYTSYQWYRDGYPAGTGSSYSETFCGDNVTYTESFGLSVTVTDSVGSQASSGNYGVSIFYRRSGTTCDPYATGTTGKIICPQQPAQ